MKAGGLAEDVGGCVVAMVLVARGVGEPRRGASVRGLLWARVRGGVCDRPRVGAPPIGLRQSPGSGGGGLL